MSDETNSTSTLEAAPADGATPKDDAAVDYKAEAEKWKALARKHENRARENAEAAKRVTELEDARSDAEKLAARVAELEQATAKATTEATRQRIVNETGLPVDLADLVTGPDEDAMRATAERIKAHLAPAQKFGPVDTGPKNVTDSGLPKQLTRADLAGMSPDQIVQAQESGQLADLMAGKH